MAKHAQRLSALEAMFSESPQHHDSQGIEKANKVRQISLAQLIPYDNQPFRPLTCWVAVM